jgi:hypothetical protein
MWRWDGELGRIGFRRRGERFWLCERRYGLVGSDHVSVFSWSEQSLPGGTFLVEVTEFHVTLYRGGEHLHFYYHEMLDNQWHPAGHTSGAEIRRLGLDPERLRDQADLIAAVLAEALGGGPAPREAGEG